MVDLIKYFDATTLLVTPSKLGYINDTLLSLSALEKEKLKFVWCVNLYQDKKNLKKFHILFIKRDLKICFIFKKI